MSTIEGPIDKMSGSLAQSVPPRSDWADPILANEGNLPLPDEPTELRARTRALIEEEPAAGAALLDQGSWIVDVFWPAWEGSLSALGINREELVEVLVGYRRELWLWVMGERIWAHCASGLAGRVCRRAASLAGMNDPTARATFGSAPGTPGYGSLAKETDGDDAYHCDQNDQ